MMNSIMNVTMHITEVYLRELHIGEGSDGRLCMRKFPDALLEEAAHNQSAIACIETFLVPINLIKENNSGQGCCSLRKGVVYPA